MLGFGNTDIGSYSEKGDVKSSGRAFINSLQNIQ